MWSFKDAPSSSSVSPRLRETQHPAPPPPPPPRDQRVPHLPTGGWGPGPPVWTLQGREGLGRQLTSLQLAERGTQNASRRVGTRSFARVALPGCSRRLGLREARGCGQPLPPVSDPARAPGAAGTDWPAPTCPKWVGHPQSPPQPPRPAAYTPGGARPCPLGFPFDGLDSGEI